MADQPKCIVYIAASLDGYIAKTGDNLDFLNRVMAEGEDYGYNAFISSVETVILGRRTYDWVMGQVKTFPHTDKEVYVITRNPRPDEGHVKFYSGKLFELIARLKQGNNKHIFCDGGAALVNALLQEGLIDEIIISVIPVLLGEGIRLFADGRPEQVLKLVSSKSFTSGLVQLHYEVLNG